MNNILILFTMCLVSCSNKITNQEAITYANNYIMDNFPNNVFTEPTIEENSKYYIIKYDLPVNWVGGAPIIIIDKESGEIVRAIKGQ